MATQTTNYNLTKPLESEFYDVGVQNENMDKIDTQMKANADAIQVLQNGQSNKADLVDGKVPAEQLPNMDCSEAISEHNESESAHGDIREALAGKASGAHSHSAADIQTGVLPPERGGTGAESLAGLAAELYTYGTEDLTAGTSPLATGKLYFVYE